MASHSKLISKLKPLRPLLPAIYLRRLRSVTTSTRRRQIFNMLKTGVGAVSSWYLRRKIATHLAQPALPRRYRRSIGAMRLRRKLEYCQLLPVLAGAQTRHSPAQRQDEPHYIAASAYLRRIGDDFTLAVFVQHRRPLVLQIIVVDSPDVLRDAPVPCPCVQHSPPALQ